MTGASSQLNLGKAERIGFSVAGGTIAGLVTGPAAGVPVLLVPGYTGSKEDFGPILDGIAAAGFRAVAIDLPGQFESRGTGDPAQYTPTRLAAVVRSLAAHLGPTVHLLGHSFGGLVARAAVISEPSRFASLVLMDSGPAALGGKRAVLISMLEPLLERSGIAAVYDATEAVYRSEEGYLEPEPALADFLRRRFVAGSPAMLKGMGRALRDEPDRVADLAATGVPTLVLYGTADDAWLPADQDLMAKRLNAPVARIPDAVHSPAVENPGPTQAALIDFWARQSIA